MDLFGSKELSAEQRFMFMLDDKVDRLIDERNSIAVFHKYMNCQDPSEMSRDVFMRIHLKDKEAVKKLWEELGEMKCKVEGYTLASKDVLVQKERVNVFKKDSYMYCKEVPNDENQTIQAYLQFPGSMVVSKLGYSICNALEKSIIVHNEGEYGGGLYLEGLDRKSKYVKLYYLYYMFAGDKIDQDEAEDEDMWSRFEKDMFYEKDKVISKAVVDEKLRKRWRVGNIIDLSKEYHTPLLRIREYIEE